MWTLNRMARILLSKFNLIWDQLASTIVFIRISIADLAAIQQLFLFEFLNMHIKTKKIKRFQNLCSLSQNSWNQVCLYQSSLSIKSSVSSDNISHNRRILSSRLSSFFFLNTDLHLACVCVGIMLQSTAWKKAFLSWIFPTESSDYPHVIALATSAVMHSMHCIIIICLLRLESLLKI